MIKSYKDLIVWQKSFKLSLEVYKLTGSFPKAEIFGLTSQMRRCAVSIPANIAEGYARHGLLEYIQFLKIAFGSGAELETHLMIAKEVGLITQEEFEKSYNLLREVMSMLNTLISKLKAKKT